MLSVRGESILSRIGDDNFVVEDKTAAHHEVMHYLLCYYEHVCMQGIYVSLHIS